MNCYGSNCSNRWNHSCNMNTGDGYAMAQGPQGIQGETGATGAKGETGAAGETPTVTVVEDTPTSYKLNFKTTAQDLTTPNLYADTKDYHANLSALNSILNVPVGNLILRLQTTSTTSVRMSVNLKDAATPIQTDIRRTTIYGGDTIEVQTFDNTRVTGQLVIDDLVYTQSQKEHSIKIRQQDPATQLWSLCEIHSFISFRAARTSIWVKWVESGVSYAAPS